MKKNEKKKYSLLLIIITFMISASAYLFNINKKEKYVNCIARMVYVQGAITQHLTLSFMFNRDDLSGVVHIEGVQLQSNVSEGFINRNIHFSYKKNEENFILTATEVRTIKGESLSQDEIQRTFPAFYSTANSKITYTISGQKNEGYLFLIAGTPRFFCEK
ncbi:YqeJ protein [Trabulsiella guamensis ATCC 49490]|uniref:YqeJ protein n=1 Tax=Trabulsiella guamensis ATCC 49490 TaxID=1005994 RepID=A0A084ZPD7_9ENTR|nr:hypothetical protein [Trabulsiella guamensis]KFB99331.1 YqeJ protein [Trabulsiella guamensis ATCC 49490]